MHEPSALEPIYRQSHQDIMVKNNGINYKTICFCIKCSFKSSAMNRFVVSYIIINFIEDQAKVFKKPTKFPSAQMFFSGHSCTTVPL